MRGNHFNMNDSKFDAVVAAVRAASPDATEADILSIIDGDWPNAEDHQEWLNTATPVAIADWVDGVYINTIQDYYER